MTDADHMYFQNLASIIVDRSVWGAVLYPWTFIITFENDHYTASASDCRNEPIARTDLGNDFVSLEAAQESCREFVKREQAK